ncbi:MAG: LicD family protein [Bacteroidales bacterium]|nr:LicD family protein [Bacteroidales bacterium]
MILKDIIKKTPFLYKPLLWVVNDVNNRKRSRAYKKYGKEALRLFVKCMDDNNYKYTLAFGSILGAVREHGFIKHDLDIDTFIWYEDYNPLMIEQLKQYGFTLDRTITIENDEYGREDTFMYKGVNIDIFYVYHAIDKYPYCCDFVSIENHKRLPRRIEIPLTKARKLQLFEGINVYIPENAEEICEFRYGPNYMTPDPNWHWVSSYNAIREWPEMIDKVVELSGV